MSIFRRLFPTKVEKLRKGVLKAILNGYDYPRVERLVDGFLETATPDQVMELYWASLEGDFGKKQLTVSAKHAIEASVKSLGSFAVQLLLPRLADRDERFNSPKYRVISLLGRIGDLAAFHPILKIAMKPSMRDITTTALGNLRLAEPAGWKKLVLACTAEEQMYLKGAGALSQGSEYENRTGKKWEEDYYLPEELKYELKLRERLGQDK